MKYQSFEEYLKERPYKYTKAFTEAEWQNHLHEIWYNIFKRPYTITLISGATLDIQAINYMDAKLQTAKQHNVKITDISSVL